MLPVMRWLAFVLLFVAACTQPANVATAAASDSTPDSSGGSTSGGSAGGGDSTPAASASTASAQTAPVDCTGHTGQAGDNDVTMQSGGLSREALFHAPPSYDGKTPLPLVLVLHPLLAQNTLMRALVKIERFSDVGQGFLTVFPNGINRSWNAGACCGDARDQNVDDVGFMKDIIAKASSTYCVDPARIFAMGYSNGAFLSHMIACELGDTIKAIAPVAGTLGISADQCTRTTPLPVLAFHGTDDTLVPYAGGSPTAAFGIFSDQGTFQAPTVTDAFWAAHDKDPTTTTTSFQQGDVTCAQHAGTASVTLCTIQGGGHQWPGSVGIPGLGDTTQDIDATEAAVKFFGLGG